jgi:enamine deaminase RidA (YjgF/YER057c/UK114 family)
MPGGTSSALGDIAAQTEQVLRNLRTALAAASARPEHVVKWNVVVVDGQDFGSGYVTQPAHYRGTAEVVERTGRRCGYRRAPNGGARPNPATIDELPRGVERSNSTASRSKSSS